MDTVISYNRSHDKTFAKILGLVRRIPRGYVSTYGTIALYAGIRDSRIVGYALHSLEKGSTVPWHRVVNRHGKISISAKDAIGNQKHLLELEGVTFQMDQRIDLDEFGWQHFDLMFAEQQS